MISWKILAALFFIKPWLDRKIGGKKREKRELGREIEKKEPKNCVRKSVFSYKSTRNKREKKEQGNLGDKEKTY